MDNLGLSVIIPAFNEAGNINELLRRVTDTLSDIDIPYEIIVIDDHSTDTTVQRVRIWAKRFPVTLFRKEGKRGKGYSILEGAAHAAYQYIAMLDADLQYPPEILPELFTKAQETGIGVAKRKTYTSSWYRTIASKLNAFIFGRMLLDLKTDVQSGLKIFHREVFDHVEPSLISAWAIDIPLLYTAYELGFTANHVNIDFRPRSHGVSNVQFLKTAWEIASGAVKTKFSTKVRRFTAENSLSMTGSGLAYHRKRYVTHTTLPHSLSALVSLSLWQKLAITTLCAFFGIGLLTHAQQTAIVFTASISAIYFADVLFNVFIILKSLHFPPDIRVSGEDLKKIKADALPMYSILCPLYKEASVLPHFIESMNAMDWPKEKLDILLLLEEDDKETIQAAQNMQLPEHFSIVIVPDSQPKTKPKACNFGLNLAQGEYIVVYDAEDRPDPDQLKKAYLAFQRAHSTVVCMQAKLNYYNPHDNLLTRLFTAEYSLWFDVILPGLQSIQTTIPLGGTSNHFRTSELLHLEGWDPFNVTEDADLGARLFRKGYKTAIIDSTTLEEANGSVKNWFRQRSRWIKGYIQTYFVHFRNPFRFAKQYGHHAILFQLIVGGKIAFMLINPLLWTITISYFALFSLVGPTIEAIYPGTVFYMAATSLVVGNFIYLYNYMIGVAKRGQWELVKYVLFVPLYWLMISIGAGVAVFQFFAKPYYWEKTTHGLHLLHEEARREKELLRLKNGSSRATHIQKFADLVQNRQLLGGGLLVMSSMIGNVMNFLYNAYLGRHLSIEDFGEISLFGSLLSLSAVPLSALSRTVTHTSAFLLGKFGLPIKPLWESLRKRTLVYSIGISMLWLIITPLLMRFFRIESALPFILFTPVWVIGSFNAINGGFLNGNLLFATTALTAVLESASKFTFTAGFVNINLHQYVYASIPLSLFFVMLVEWFSIHRLADKKPAKPVKPGDLALSHKFYFTSILTSLTKATYLSLDLVLAKHFLTPVEAGAYSYLSLAGKMVYFLSSTVSQFLIPYVSRDLGAGASPKQSFRRLLILISLVNFAAFLIFGAFGYITAPLLWGSKATLIIRYLPAYALAMALFSTTSAIIIYQQIRGRHFFPIFAFLLALLMVIGMYLEHHSIGEIVLVVSITSVISLVGVLLLTKFYGVVIDLFHAFIDFIGLFKPLPPTSPYTDGTLRILIFNWRDLRHKWAGGAEVYLHEIGKRWVRDGHEVTIFSGNDGKSARFERLDGVWLVRRGGFYLVYLWAFLYYFLRLRGRYDVIIDSENGLPFFTPLYVSEPVFLLIHHVHQEVFRKRLPPPFSWLALLLECRVMPVVYRHTDVITVSPSSKNDILRNKLTARDPHVIYNGVDPSAYVPGNKSESPTVLYLGRLTASKSVHILIAAVKSLVESVPNIRVIVAGDGPARKSLERLTKKLRLEHVITFLGRVDDGKKIKLYQNAWVFVNPSLIEGWGITTIEANACGTPVIASNVAGLCDAVHDTHSGFLVPYGNAEAFAAKIYDILTNKKLRDEMSQASYNWAAQYSWDTSAATAMLALKARRGAQHEFTWIKNTKSPSYPKHLTLGTANYRGLTVFVKSWINPPQNAFNEVKAYRSMATNLAGNVRLPKLLFVDRIGRTLNVGLEYIEGKTLSSFKEKRQLLVYKQVLAALDKIDTSGHGAVKRPGSYILATFPYILLKAAGLRPKFAMLYFISAFHFATNSINLLQGKLKLAHRDLGADNILVTKKYIYLIDWQYVAFTLPVYELVGAWRSLSRDRRLGASFLRHVKTAYQKDAQSRAQFKSLSIYYTLLGLSDPNYHPARVNDFIYLLKTANRL